MCCSGPTWKREVVPEHKFDFVDTRDYRENTFWTSLRYLWLYIVVIKSFLVYVSDIFTAVTMLTTNQWTNNIYEKCNVPQASCTININFSAGKWIFVGCIILGFLLVIYEARKARKIILSRDISYAFTNVMANNYYSLRSYDHFCFFCQISASQKKKDEFAFFIFFTFKGWKRLLLAEGPRQVINGITLFSYAQVNDFSTNLYVYYNGDILTAGLLISMLFTTLVFAFSLIVLVVAGVLYLPLLCYIRGNLKEYCCHRVDKRISELIKRKVRQRVVRQAALARKEAAGDYSHYKNKNGAMRAMPLPQPTLPKVNVEDDYSSAYNTEVDTWSDYKAPVDYLPVIATPAIDYPPVMPGYNDSYPPYPAGQVPQPYLNTSPYPPAQFAPYIVSSPTEELDAEDEYGSTAHLALSAAPMAYGDAKLSQTSLQSSSDRAQQYSNTNYLDVERQPARQRPSSGLAYDEEPDYVSYYQESAPAAPADAHTRSRSGGGGRGGVGYAV